MIKNSCVALERLEFHPMGRGLFLSGDVGRYSFVSSYQIDISQASQDELYSKIGIVYIIFNLKNNKLYVGETNRRFIDRYRSGKWWLNSHNKKLKIDALKCGNSNFKVSII